jgi:hypothetical protein
VYAVDSTNLTMCALSRVRALTPWRADAQVMADAGIARSTGLRCGPLASSSSRARDDLPGARNAVSDRPRDLHPHQVMPLAAPAASIVAPAPRLKASA